MVSFHLPPAVADNSTTVPQPPPQRLLPPFSVVPYRLPDTSWTRPAIGPQPSLPWQKVCSTLSFHPLAPGDSSKATPAVPYRLPVLSMMTPAHGAPPSLHPEREQKL